MANDQKHPIIFYDGLCGLCDKSVQFLIKRDIKKRLRYAPLQSSLAVEKLGDKITFDSFVYYENGKAFYQSTAALKALRNLNGLWPLLYAFIIIPPFVRNILYKVVARNRYKLFGKFDSCKIPTPEQKELFIA